MFESHVKRDRCSPAFYFVSTSPAGTVADLISNSDCETSWTGFNDEESSRFFIIVASVRGK